MREIKFRAWDKEKKVFVKGMLCFEYDDFDWVLLNDNYEQILWNYNGVLCQYTGLKDKNGVEIYEGDIITHDDFRINGEITFSRGCFRAFDFTLANFEAIHHISRIEVIGNIYENKELLGDNN